MEVAVSTGAILRHAKLQLNRHHQQTIIQFFTGWMPFLSPNQQCQTLKGNVTWRAWKLEYKLYVSGAGSPNCMMFVD